MSSSVDTARVFVIIVPDSKNGNSRSQQLRELFSDPLFIVTTIGRDDEPLLNLKGVSNSDILDYNYFRRALILGSKIHPDIHTLVVKDTSVSGVTPDKMASVVSRSFRSSYDLFYLCKWLDRCHLYTDALKDQENVSTAVDYSLFRTQSPQGLQAITFSPHGRDIILGQCPMPNGYHFFVNGPFGAELTEEIYKGNLNAICSVPNIIDYDIALNAKENSDYLKLNECVPVAIISNDKTGGSGNLLYFIVVVIMVIVIAWAALKIGSEPQISK